MDECERFSLPRGFVASPASGGGAVCWMLFQGDRLWLRAGDPGLPVATAWPLAGVEAEQQLVLGALAGVTCIAAALPEAVAPPPGWEPVGLRGAWQRVPDDLLGVAGMGLQLLTWDREHRYCGACATPTEPAVHERARTCPACGLACYPRLSPVVMVRIERDGAILLARSPRFAPGVYSVLAGFVEAGETLEQAVRREVAEEVGLEVGNLRYCASQPWPFPHSLMIGFRADWVAGEIRVDGVEIESADWFRPGAMPLLPAPMSLSRHLIDDYLGAEQP